MKRVMILSRRSAFWSGVYRLLEERPECDLVGWESDPDCALARIREMRPDVVLIDKADAAADRTSPVMRILGEGLGTRVIALGLEDNKMSLYREERRTADDENELIRAIEGDLSVADGSGEFSGSSDSQPQKQW